MSSSYGRRCRYCDRWISLRQMPYGQWVAFEGDSPHRCDKPPKPAESQPPKKKKHINVPILSEEGFTPREPARPIKYVAPANIQGPSAPEPVKTQRQVAHEISTGHAAGNETINGSSPDRLREKSTATAKSGWSWIWGPILLFVLLRLIITMANQAHFHGH